MKGDDHMVFEFPQALTDYQDEYRQRQTRHDPYGIGMAMSLPHSIAERIQWTTPLGTPKLHDDNSLITFDVYWS